MTAAETKRKSGMRDVNVVHSLCEG